MKNSNMAQNELWLSARQDVRATKGLKGNSISNKDHCHLQFYRNEDEDGVWYTLECISYHYVYTEKEKHNGWDSAIKDQFHELFNFLESFHYIQYVYDEWDDHIVGFYISETAFGHLFMQLHYCNRYKWNLPMILDISAY